MKQQKDVGRVWPLFLPVDGAGAISPGLLALTRFGDRGGQASQNAAVQ